MDFKMTLFLPCLFTVLIGIVKGQCYDRSGYFAHESQCDRYYVCKNGQVVDEGLCPDGYVFQEWGNPKKLRCELPFNVDCSGRSNLQAPQQTGMCPRANGMFRHSADCSQFIECGNGVAHVKSCPAGLAWNDRTGNCDWPENTDCPSEEVVGFSCPQPTQRELSLFGHPRYAHPTDCRMLYACVASTHDVLAKRSARLLGCEEGFVFNSNTGSCDYPQNVPGCENYYSNSIDARTYSN